MNKAFFQREDDTPLTIPCITLLFHFSHYHSRLLHWPYNLIKAKIELIHVRKMLLAR